MLLIRHGSANAIHGGKLYERSNLIVRVSADCGRRRGCPGQRGLRPPSREQTTDVKQNAKSYTLIFPPTYLALTLLHDHSVGATSV